MVGRTPAYLGKKIEAREVKLAAFGVLVMSIVVLDLGLPDMDGTEVCKRIRSRSDALIVVLAADGSEDRKVDALDGGADDYMTTPSGMRELNARLRVAPRPTPSATRTRPSSMSRLPCPRNRAS